MWTDVLRATYVALTTTAEASVALDRAGALLQLLEHLEHLQSQPDELAAASQRAINDVGVGASDPSFVEELGARMHGTEALTGAEWLLLTCLGELTELLESGWQSFYEPIGQGYPDLARTLQSLRTALRPVPFAAALAKLSHDWAVGDDLVFDRIAVAFVRVCAMIGAVDATGDVYRRTATLLSFEREFFSVWMAGACLKLQPVAGAIDLSELSREQYACMRMLDQFSSLPGIPWG